ncbi:hypothetical protein DP939_02415 [Spongiactinospora rosea]|uniref:Uncharacterized protein n=1 Tax=Spongiactinospora rosea TaxID=2248750 RepID=A0A366M7F1_9ACTN|nr:hypothetical protein [Spongiactinospora rosea]RBQ22168.1 hypothetical protein DP939_02415 [Spongiactinospora rosea]
MVPAPGIIAPEIAEKYDRALTTVQKTWTRHPDWPKPRGRRGRWAEYDADAVDKLVRRVFLRAAPVAEGRPDDLLTIAQIADHTGLARGTIDADISRGRWPAPDEIEHGVKRWRRSTVNSALGKRRGYHRSG